MAKEDETVRARVVRDIWTTDTDEGRLRAGSIVTVTKDVLIQGLETGALARAKDDE